MFTTKDALLDQYIESARKLWRIHEENRTLLRGARYKKRKENLERSIKVLSLIPSGWAGALITKQKELLQGESKVATWVAAVQCEDCSSYHLATSLKPVDTRFVCRDCGGWCGIVHIEGAEVRANQAHTVSRGKHEATRELETDIEDHRLWALHEGCTVRRGGKQCKWCDRGDTKREVVERDAVRLHARFVDEQGSCSVQDNGSHCPWCEEWCEEYEKVNP